MRRARSLAASCSLLLGVVATAAAQGPPGESPQPPGNSAYVALSQDQSRELVRWISAMEKWQAYDAKWHNRPVYDAWGRVVARRPPPEPPAWLEARCAAAAAAAAAADAAEFDERTTKACRLLADPRARDEAVPAPVQAARLEAEKPRKRSSFFTRLHIDGLWTTASTGGRFYGIVGSHMSLVDVGRVQIFGPPGIMFLSVPDDDGSRRLALGYTWGVSVRLMDVRLFAPDRNMTLFFNVSKVWVDFEDAGGKFRGYDIAGFSLAPRKKR